MPFVYNQLHHYSSKLCRTHCQYNEYTSNFPMKRNCVVKDDWNKRCFTYNFRIPKNMEFLVWGGADKSWARPGGKQATANKLGIYSTHSPRSPIHFLALFSTFCKLLKKIQNVVRPTRSPRLQWPPRRTKNGQLPIVLFSVHGNKWQSGGARSGE